MPHVVERGQVCKEPAPGGGVRGVPEDRVFNSFIFFEASGADNGFVSGKARSVGGKVAALGGHLIKVAADRSVQGHEGVMARGEGNSSFGAGVNGLDQWALAASLIILRVVSGKRRVG